MCKIDVNVKVILMFTFYLLKKYTITINQGAEDM